MIEKSRMLYAQYLQDYHPDRLKLFMEGRKEAALQLMSPREREIVEMVHREMAGFQRDRGFVTETLAVGGLARRAFAFRGTPTDVDIRLVNDAPYCSDEQALLELASVDFLQQLLINRELAFTYEDPYYSYQFASGALAPDTEVVVPGQSRFVIGATAQSRPVDVLLNGYRGFDSNYYATHFMRHYPHVPLFKGV